MSSETTHDDQGHSTPAGTGRGGEPRGPLAGPLGIGLSVVLLGVAIFTAYYQIYVNVKQEPYSEVPVMYICSETGKQFQHVIKINEESPVLSPFSNKRTGYRAEKCYWSPDGKLRDYPTYVLLNEHCGKPGPTTCPECGRVVVPHNPKPVKADDNKIEIPTPRTGDAPTSMQAEATTQPADH